MLISYLVSENVAVHRRLIARGCPSVGRGGGCGREPAGQRLRLSPRGSRAVAWSDRVDRPRADGPLSAQPAGVVSVGRRVRRDGRVGGEERCGGGGAGRRRVVLDKEIFALSRILESSNRSTSSSRNNNNKNGRVSKSKRYTGNSDGNNRIASVAN